MKTFKFIGKMIAIILIIKILFFFGGIVSKDKAVEKPMIERFLNEFVINNPGVKYPIKVDDVTTFRSRKLVKENGIYFVVENMQMNVARETFTIPYQEVGDALKKELLPDICKLFKGERENLFKGYSQVGLIEKYVDINNKFVAEVKFHISNCL